MMRSLSSAVAGLKSHQTKMDVIGNNIANVNTAGFKASRATFSDVYYQTLGGAATPSDSTGGTNPTQIGYGSAIASIDILNTQSGASSTDRALDVYLEGDGFIVTKDSEGTRYYSRLGNLGFDARGRLVDSSGNLVLGMPKMYETDGTEVATPDINGMDVIDMNKSVVKILAPKANPTDPDTYTRTEFSNGTVTIGTGADAKEYTIDDIRGVSIGPNGEITGVLGQNVVEIGRICIAKFRNAPGLEQAGNSKFIETSNSGSPQVAHPGKDGTGKLKAGYLEMSNVDIAREFSEMITTQRGFQANSRIITVSDEMLQELVNLKR